MQYFYQKIFMIQKSNLLLITLFCVFSCCKIQAQTKVKNTYFSFSSSTEIDAKDYGVINLKASQHALLIGTVMANGENVKGLTIQIGNGFPFKLAPSQIGSILNYIGSSLNIVVPLGETAKIEFINGAKGPSARQ